MTELMCVHAYICPHPPPCTLLTPTISFTHTPYVLLDTHTQTHTHQTHTHTPDTHTHKLTHTRHTHTQRERQRERESARESERECEAAPTLASGRSTKPFQLWPEMPCAVRYGEKKLVPTSSP